MTTPTTRQLIARTNEQRIAEDATGCVGSGDYRKWAEAQGYEHCEVLDWSSSAGDWQFIVSKDGETWFIMEQENNYPRPGFTRTVGTEEFFGTADEVLQQIAELYQ